MKKLITSLCIMLVLSGCSASNGKSKFTAGEYEATSKGFGGDVTVKLTVGDTEIKNVEITADDETPEIGGKAIETLKENILKANGDEIDGVSGATFTSDAVKNAYNEAIASAKGSSNEETAQVKDGKYTTKAMGHEDWVYVTTQFKDGAIVSCSTTSHEETMGIGNYAAARIPARILENQSLEVDSVSGATVTSNAVKKAVKDAIEQAGGSSVHSQNQLKSRLLNQVKMYLMTLLL